MTPAEQLRTQRTGITGELQPKPEGTTIGPPMTGVKAVATKATDKPEDYEFGEFAKKMDPLFQFTTEWVNARAFGLPKILTKLATGEGTPEPLSTAGSLAGGFGGLSGMTGWNYPKWLPLSTSVPISKTGAPFEVAARAAQRILRKPAETNAGKILQSVAKSVLTLAFGEAAVSSRGENAKEILINKIKATGSGGITGAVFGGTNLAKFSSRFPVLSWVVRAGMSSAVLDAMNGQTPWDARPLMQKAYDYGLNIVFTRHAMSPKDMERLTGQEGMGTVREATRPGGVVGRTGGCAEDHYRDAHHEGRECPRSRCDTQ